MKHLKALFAIALVAFFAAPAFAETQNVKVSGSMDAYWFYHSEYDLADSNDQSALPAGGTAQSQSHTGNLNYRSDADSYFRSNTQVEVSADLTDNVSTVINVVNQRDWNADTWDSSTGVGPNTTADEFDIDLDLAYVQMKEIFYSPLTLTIGRQDLWFGRGFIIGNNSRAWDANGDTLDDMYSVTTAFDAVRATLDFAPWTLDFVYANITENSQNAEDDIDLWIANINYKFAEYNAVAEGYIASELDRATLSTVANSGTQLNATHTLGGRAQFDPISQITLGGEVAYQFGGYHTTTNGRDRDAWAADLFGTYRWDNAWKPELTLEYVYFSGEENLSTSTSDSYGAWNPMYRGKFWTAYADFREFVYATADSVDDPATTNQSFIQVKGAMKPLEDLLLEASFTYLWTTEDIHNTKADIHTATRDSNIGWEVDLQATYDYTEDVSFGILAAWFIPGDFYVSPEDQTATDIVSSVKVSF